MPGRSAALRRLHPGEDRGAFAILYVTLVLLLAMVAALVVDIGMLRMDRSLERAAADSAASAGAGDLTQVPNSRNRACRTAFEYALLNLGEDKATATYPPCNTLPVTCSDSTPTTEVSGTSGRFTITVASPVADDSSYMEPDVAPGNPAQTINPTIDGTRCERLGVNVNASRSFVLGTVEGFTGASTGVHAVARAQLTGTTTTDALIGLAALDSSACHGIRITGSGGLAVQRSTTGSLPGVIAVDSDATGGSGANDCSSGLHKAIEISQGSGDLHAYPSTTGQLGQIRSFALAGPQAGRAFEPAMTSGCTPAAPNARLCPVPISVSEQLTREPWDDRYNCQPASGCATPAYVDQLDSQLGGPGLPVGTTTLPLAAWTPVEQAAFCGTGPGQVDQFFASGTYYISCPTWTVTTPIGFGDGSTVILNRNLYIDDTGCFVIGVADMPSRDLACAGNPPASGRDSRLFTRNGGGITRERNGILDLVDTLVRSDGPFDMHPGGNGDLRWTAPTSGNLAGLAYWGELAPSAFTDSQDGNTPNGFTHRIAGIRSGVQLTGVFFAPNGLLQLNIAGTGTDTWRAQLAADRITSMGGADLDLQPSTAWALQVPVVGTNLIR